MPLIDSTYFDDTLIIAGLNTEPISDAVDAAIAKYEPEFLRKLMGRSLYTAYLAALAAGGGESGFSSGFSSGFGSGGDLEERFMWVRDGYAYTVSNKHYVWVGLDQAIAKYVYCRYRTKNVTQTGTLTETQQEGQGAKTVSPGAKIAEEWNEMVDLCRAFAHMVYYLRANDANVYPEFDRYEPDSEVYSYINTVGI